MPVEILMPALSPTMTEGKLFKWLKEEGDTIEPGDAVAEIETDKATMEVEAVDSGVLQKILVAEETEGVPVNTPIALLAVDGEENGALSDNQVEPSVQAPAKEIVEPVQNELNSKNSQRKPSAAGTSIQTVREALRDAMAEEMRVDDSVFVMGEEVAEYEGAYKVTQGLLKELVTKE